MLHKAALILTQQISRLHFEATHCVKSVRIRSYSAPHFPASGLNMDQNNSEYGHFLHIDSQGWAGGNLNSLKYFPTHFK